MAHDSGVTFENGKIKSVTSYGARNCRSELLDGVVCAYARNTAPTLKSYSRDEAMTCVLFRQGHLEAISHRTVRVVHQ
jgi:hypothetical protein